jgi:GntR family transcriptional regulator/MocR family aminotransferase
MAVDRSTSRSGRAGRSGGVGGKRLGGADLHLDLRLADTGTGVRASLMEALRDAVRTGRLAKGVRLPSSRSLAADLGIARNTVVDAYGELIAEGWLNAAQGSGTRVAGWTAPPRPRPLRPRRRPVSRCPRTTCSPGGPTPRPSRAPSGCGRPAGRSRPPRTRPSTTAVRAGGSSCAPRSPRTSPAPGGCAPTRNGS